MDVREQYKAKLVSAVELAGKVQDHWVLYVNSASSFPCDFVDALAARGEELVGVRLNHAMRREVRPLTRDPVDPALSGHILHISDFTWDDPVRQAIWEGRATYRPTHPTETARFYPWEINLFVSAASPMDSEGYLSLGAFGGWGMGFLPLAKQVALEVNPAQPHVPGGCRVHISEVDYIVEADYPMTAMSTGSTLEQAVATDVEMAIAGNVFGLIENGCTLQIGAGTVPNVVASLIIDSDIKGLNLHTEAVFDWLVDLTEAGKVDNTGKPTHQGRTLFALALGSPRLYQFLHENPGVEMQSIAYVNNPALISQNPRQIAVNTTLAVDLWGQCASETLGHRHYSGSGGQWEFNRGAYLSPGGKGVIALPSTAKGGTISRISACLPEGSAVTIPRNDVDYIVTEYGVARLKGKDTRDRALELISIAHPDFRGELKSMARKHGLI